MIERFQIGYNPKDDKLYSFLSKRVIRIMILLLLILQDLLKMVLEMFSLIVL